jgi:hypothetical protein
MKTETLALEAFLRFTLRTTIPDGRVWHRDHWDKDFRMAIELCEELGIVGVVELRAIEQQSKELAEETTCNKRHANGFAKVAFSVFGCHLCKKFPFSVCVERKAGAFSPADIPDDGGTDETKRMADEVKDGGGTHLKPPNVLSGDRRCALAWPTAP